jgi:hypothetical protein
MDSIEVDLETEFLLDWVGKNAPQLRHRTLSVPGIDFSYGTGFGSGNLGVYGGMEEGNSRWSTRRRLTDGYVPRRHRPYKLSPFFVRKQSEQ